MGSCDRMESYYDWIKGSGRVGSFDLVYSCDVVNSLGCPAIVFSFLFFLNSLMLIED